MHEIYHEADSDKRYKFGELIVFTDENGDLIIRSRGLDRLSLECHAANQIKIISPEV